jgi:hypothetical protein
MLHNSLEPLPYGLSNGPNLSTNLIACRQRGIRDSLIPFVDIQIGVNVLDDPMWLWSHAISFKPFPK